MDTKPWFSRTATGHQRRLKVAYFCSEYALHESMPQYAGGLGVLAGDHLKSASDLGVPLVAVGRLYRHGYYNQQLKLDGSTLVTYPTYDFTQWPLVDTGLTVAVMIAKRKVFAKIWKLQVGRTEAYLLDADIPKNKSADRKLTHQLYVGDQELRLQQQILLGIGGPRALQALDIQPTVYHLNEGHAAFCGLERLRVLLAKGKSLEKATEIIRASSVFTTHTPVPAGHDRYDPKWIIKYLAPIRAALGLEREDFLALGRENPADKKEPFCMTVLALKLSEHVNGVAKLHGQVSRGNVAGRLRREIRRQSPDRARNQRRPYSDLAGTGNRAALSTLSQAALGRRLTRPKNGPSGPNEFRRRNSGPYEICSGRNSSISSDSGSSSKARPEVARRRI